MKVLREKPSPVSDPNWRPASWSRWLMT